MIVKPAGTGGAGKERSGPGPLPGGTPAQTVPPLLGDLSDLVFEAEAGGMTHAQLINAILDAALERYPQLARRVLPEPALAMA